jgi:hypothetical protein
MVGEHEDAVVDGRILAPQPVRAPGSDAWDSDAWGPHASRTGPNMLLWPGPAA